MKKLSEIQKVFRNVYYYAFYMNEVACKK